MSSSARCKFLSGRILAAGAALAIFSLIAQQSSAQNLTINFRFDGQTGAAATTQTIDAASAGKTYTVDVWATITGPSGTAGSNVGLVTLRYRGLSSTSADTAFATGSGIGVVPGSFTIPSPFNSTANIPTIGDVGSASAYATTSTTLDGISDFGGTTATSAAVANSNSGTTPELGGTASPSSQPVTNGWEFLVGQFKFTTGQAASAGTTSFLPVTGLGASASKQSYTVDGGATFVHGDWSSGSAINFVVAGATGVIADNTNGQNNFAAGTPQTFSVAAGGPYTTVDSSVTGVAGTGGNTAFPPSAVGNRARILAGSNGTAGTQTVTMAWRTRTQAEAVGGAVFDPSLSKPTTGLISDVVNLTGLETTGTTTGPFVLDMTYNPALLPKGSTTNGHTTPSTLEGALAANKLIYMISLNPTTGLWDRAFAENTGNTVTSSTDPNYGFQGSFSAFATARFGTASPTNAQLATLMGAWGTDISTHDTWAILDHNSQFAVVPEPSTLLMVGLGLLGLVGLRRRIKA